MQETNNVRRPAPTTRSGSKLASLPFFFFFVDFCIRIRHFSSMFLFPSAFSIYITALLTTFLVLYNIYPMIGVRLAWAASSDSSEYLALGLTLCTGWSGSERLRRQCRPSMSSMKDQNGLSPQKHRAPTGSAIRTPWLGTSVRQAPGYVETSEVKSLAGLPCDALWVLDRHTLH